MEEVKILQKNEIHKEIGDSPNQLYKRYTRWFNEKYGKDKRPLPYKDWLEWAKDKNIIEDNVSSDYKKVLPTGTSDSRAQFTYLFNSTAAHLLP